MPKIHRLWPRRIWHGKFESVVCTSPHRCGRHPHLYKFVSCARAFRTLRRIHICKEANINTKLQIKHKIECIMDQQNPDGIISYLIQIEHFLTNGLSNLFLQSHDVLRSNSGNFGNGNSVGVAEAAAAISFAYLVLATKYVLSIGCRTLKYCGVIGAVTSRVHDFDCFLQHFSVTVRSKVFVLKSV